MRQIQMKDYCVPLGLALGLLVPGGHARAVPNEFLPDGVQTRTSITEQDSYARSVGKLRFLKGRDSIECTATLIGYDLILTAAHCGLDDNGNLLTQGDFQFIPAYPLLEDTASAIPVSYGTRNPKAEPKNDWMLFKLDQNLGSKYGIMRVRDQDLTLKFNQPIFSSIGYNGDWQGGEVASLSSQCKLTALEAGALLENCASSSGGSGGPIFYRGEDGQNYLIAIQVSGKVAGADRKTAYSRETANLAVSEKAFFKAAEKALKP